MMQPLFGLERRVKSEELIIIRHSEISGVSAELTI
jgi:hypothetical protein